ncbi:MAG: GTP-binding protein [Clostridium sp.]|nr:GTP-binding protein [Clostridium sp.]
MDKRIPVTVLTGFLGSGKTTLLQRLLNCEEGAGVAVMINELGEVALDHLFVQKLTESTIVLKNGCICCTMREDLQTGLRELIDGRSRGIVAPFDRVVVETTGLADPTPIAQTLDGDIMLRRQVRLANIITTIDAVFGAEQLDTHEESLRQAAIADRLVLTKTDIATPEQTALAREKIHKVNPMAIVLDSNSSESLWPMLFDIDPFNPETKSAEVQAWLNRLPEIAAADSEHGEHHHHHHGGEDEHIHHYHEGFHHDENEIQTFSIRTEKPLNWTAFAIWLSALVHRYGTKILRIKGLLNVPGALGPVVLNTVQSHITPPMHLDEWPDEDRSSRIVFIVQGISPKMVQTSLEHFLTILEK